MQRLAKRTVHRSLACVATLPLALGAFVYFFGDAPGVVSGGATPRTRGLSSWGLKLTPPTPAAGAAALTGGEGAVSSSAAVASSDTASDGHAPDSQVIGEGRTPGANGPEGSRDGSSGGHDVGRTTTLRARVAKTDGATSADGVTGQLVTAGAIPTNGANASSEGAKAPSVEDLPPGTGLRGEYWDHESEIRRIPNLDLSGATLVRIDPVVDFDMDRWNLPFVPLETWATCWRGYLKVLNAGVHGFVIGSDDGGLLEIDNHVICGVDRLQGYTESRGELELAKGLHVIKVRFFNNRGPGACRLFWIPPGATEQAIIPPDVLYPAGGPAEVGRPLVKSIGPQGAKRDEQITIKGENFSDIPSLNKVRFGPGHVPAIVIASTATEIVALVPPGVDQGPVEVTVGDQTAPAVPFEVGGIFGLRAQYWQEKGESDVLDYADPMKQGPADEEQLLGPLDIRGAARFRLPFAPVKFRACYEGRIYAHATGDHGFAIECDDGGRLFVDGRLVAEGPGLHPRQRFEGKLFLTPGWHDVRIDFFQNQGGADLTFLHSDPDQPLAVCPRGLLAPPFDLERRIVPAIWDVSPSPARAGERVMIAGEGLVGPDGRPPRVTLGAVVLPIVAASPGSVVVEIPPGVDSGDLVVRAGPLSSAPRALTVTGYGIRGEYWQIPPGTDRLPTFDASPNFVRLDDKVDFAEDVAFKLPWPTDHVGARWTADLWIGADGVYELGVGSDDGSRLIIDGQVVIENDGLHGYVERWASQQLSVGRHSLQLLFFENEGESRCRLLWKPPGVRNARVIPRTSLLPPP